MIKEIVRAKKDNRIYSKTKQYLQKINDSEIEEKMKIIDKIINISDKEERYSYLYDLICDYLDNEFKEKNICGFDCDICKRKKEQLEKNKNLIHYKNGCCFNYKKRQICEYLVPGKGCSVKNIGCKIFTCSYLRKKEYNYRLNDIYLARYFFNHRQKFYIEYTFFADKETIMKGILKRS